LKILSLQQYAITQARRQVAGKLQRSLARYVIHSRVPDQIEIAGYRRIL
jgi:hypothetical protein